MQSTVTRDGGFHRCFMQGSAEWAQPTRLAAWIEGGGGSFSKDIDVRALQMFQQLAAAERQQLQLQLQEAVTAANESLPQLSAAQGKREQRWDVQFAAEYIAGMQAVLQAALEWAAVAEVGVAERGVWWWTTP